MIRRTRMGALTATVVAVAVAALGGCGSAGGTGGLKVWALQDKTLNAIQKDSLNAFSSQNDAKARLETFGNDPYKQKLRVALGSPNAPDVFFNWGGGNLKEYVDAGKVLDLSPMLDQDPALKGAFLPSVLDAAKIGGKHYGLPMRGMQPVVLFYNKEVFAKAGARPPATWDELLALVDTFNARGVQPIALAGSQAWTGLMWAEYLLDRIGGPEVFRGIRDGKAEGWRDPAAVLALTMIRQLVDRKAFGSNFASVGYDAGGASTILAQGRAAMHLMGSWEYTQQAGQSPAFVKGGQLGWTAFPSVPGGKGDPANVVGNPANFYSVTNGSPSAETAKKFVSTTLTKPEYLRALIDAGDVPAVTGVEDLIAKAPNAEYTTWIYDLVKKAPSFQLSWDQDMPADDATLMLTKLQDVFLGKLSPEGFADALAKS